MAIYHIKENGEPGRCRAFVGNCPYGGPEDHYLSKADAARSFELRQGGSFGPQEKDELVVIEQNELRIIDARLLDKARELANAHGEKVVEIQAITEPLAIIRAARVDSIIELKMNSVSPQRTRTPSYDAVSESPD